MHRPSLLCLHHVSYLARSFLCSPSSTRFASAPFGWARNSSLISCDQRCDQESNGTATLLLLLFLLLLRVFASCGLCGACLHLSCARCSLSLCCSLRDVITGVFQGGVMMRRKRSGVHPPGGGAAALDRGVGTCNHRTVSTSMIHL